VTVPGLDELLAPEGWPYASTLSQGPGDPGRYHMLFGRDSLVTALQVLPERPDVARATLRALAARQGGADDPETGEEPGKIGHQWADEVPEPFAVRGFAPLRGGRFAYYGTADATSWWLVVLATLGDGALAAELDAHVRAAAGWLERALATGDGLVRHGVDVPAGSLAHMGWRDAIDPTLGAGGGFVREDGTAPAPPIADADSNAIAVAAARAAAALLGDEGWRRRADELAERVQAHFGPDVTALEAGDRPLTGAGSQLGWLLWADALRGDAREAAADRLSAPDVLTDHGLRTLSSEHPGFDPQHYHRGSVWPFDSWLGWGGLRAAGRAEAAERVRRGVLRALETLGDASELYVVERDGRLERSPLANRSQAWTVGARWALEHGWDGRAISARPPAARPPG